jgi:hypothetical protein
MVSRHKVVGPNTDCFFLLDAPHEHLSVFWDSLTNTYSSKLERLRRNFSTHVKIDYLRIIIRRVTTMFQRSWLRNYVTAGMSRVRVPDEVDFFFNLLNPSSRTMALASTQHLREMSTRSLPGGKGRSALKAGNPAAICEPMV